MSTELFRRVQMTHFQFGFLDNLEYTILLYLYTSYTNTDTHARAHVLLFLTMATTISENFWQEKKKNIGSKSPQKYSSPLSQYW